MTRTSLFVGLFAFCLPLATAAQSVTEAWRTGGFEGPEGLYYDAANDILYVANMVGFSDEEDGVGYISQVDPADGSVLARQWVTGLDAPKGLALTPDGSRLIVADINEAVEIDVETATIQTRIAVPGALFLNGLVFDGDALLTDTDTNSLHRFVEGVLTNSVTLEAVDGPNGIATGSSVEDASYIAGFNDGHLYRFSGVTLTTTRVTTESQGALDGLVFERPGALLATDFNTGRLLRLYTDDGTSEVVFTLSGSTALAGLAYDPLRRRVFLSDLFTNEVVAIDLGNATPARTGWYWSPDRSGRGYSFETSEGGQYFVSTYLYDNDEARSPRWYIALGAVRADGSTSDDLLEFRDGQTLNGDYVAANQADPRGRLALSLTARDGLLIEEWPGEPVALERFDIDGAAPLAAPPEGAPETGWWWNEDEQGRGWFIEIQDDDLFMAGYMYDEVGDPVWYVSIGPILSPTSYEGALLAFEGGQCFGCDFTEATQTESPGTIALSFDSPTTGRLTLPNGNQIDLVRFDQF